MVSVLLGDFGKNTNTGNRIDRKVRNKKVRSGMLNLFLKMKKMDKRQTIVK